MFLMRVDKKNEKSSYFVSDVYIFNSIGVI